MWHIQTFLYNYLQRIIKKRHGIFISQIGLLISKLIQTRIRNAREQNITIFTSAYINYYSVKNIIKCIYKNEEKTSFF